MEDGDVIDGMLHQIGWSNGSYLEMGSWGASLYMFLHYM